MPEVAKTAKEAVPDPEEEEQIIDSKGEEEVKVSQINDANDDVNYSYQDNV